VFSDPDTPPAVNLELVGNWREFVFGEVRDVTVVGNRCYVALSSGGLGIFDVSNPAQPVRLGVFPMIGSAASVQVEGSYAYVAGGVPGLQIIDVSDPAHPVRVGQYGTNLDARGVHVVGSHAYVAAGDSGLLVIDVSDPGHPRQLGNADTGDEAQAVHVEGQYAYVADEQTGLQVIDVSDPAQPVRVGRCAATEALDVQVVGPYAYVADDQELLQVVDVREPASPVPVGSAQIGATGIEVQLAGHYAYVATDGRRLYLIDVANPAQPVPIGQYDSASDIRDVQVSGQYAYLANGHLGLEILDLRDPARPTRMGGLDTGYAQGVHVSGRYAYVADGENAGLQVIDVNDPAHPVRVAGCITSPDARRVVVAGSYAYLACGGAGIEVIDVGDPLHPVRVGSYDTRGCASDVQVEDPYVFVADGHEGLVILRAAPAMSTPPVITQQPSNQTVLEGGTATFTVMATGTPPLSYQWCFNAPGATNTTLIASATTATLVLEDVQLEDAGIYWARVWNTAGSATSSLVILTVFQTGPGSVDLSYYPRLTWDQGPFLDSSPSVSAMIQQPGGKLVIAGFFDHVNGVPRNGLARLLPTGELDLSFNAAELQPRGQNYYISALALQLDGKILVGGDFDVAPWGERAIVRLNADGTVDRSFASPLNHQEHGCWELAVQPDGKILMAGRLVWQDRPLTNEIARFNADGGVDPTFALGPLLDGYLSSIALQPDGKIMLVGRFTSLADGPPNRNIARLHADGTWDGAFTTAIQGDAADHVTLQPDSKLLVSGRFTNVCHEGTCFARLNLVRLHPDGSVDPTFNVAAESYSIGPTVVQPDGKILTIVKPPPPLFVPSCWSAQFIRLNADGSLDPTFLPGTLECGATLGAGSADGSAILLQDDGRILVGGHFCWYGRVARTGLVRLNNDVVLRSPAISQQPVSQTIAEGSTVTFGVVATGTPPLFYQWLFAGQPIPAATNATLTLSNVPQDRAGPYSVVVSNRAGSVTSSRAWLTVVRLMPLAEALDTPGWTWFTGSGSGAWLGQDRYVHYGSGAAQSGRIAREQQSTLSTRVVGPGVIDFAWKVSSESHDYLAFFIGDQALASISGIVDWTHRAFYVPAGSQELRWSYVKNDEIDYGLDTAWLDEVRFTTNAPGPAVVSVAPASQTVNAENAAIFRPVATGVEPFRYQWRFNGADLTGATNAMLVIPHVTTADAGPYSVTISSPGGVTTSGPATLSVGPPLALWNWVTHSTGTNAESGCAVAIGPSGQVYVGGACDPGVVRLGAPTLTNDSWGSRALLAQFNDAGQAQWLAMPSGLRVAALTVDANGYVFTASHGDSGRSALLEKRNAAGQLVASWSVSAIGIARIRTIQTDLAGNLYVGGGFEGRLQICTNELVSTGNADAFIAKFTGTGQLLWVMQVRDPERATVWSLGVDASGAIVALGEGTGGSIGTNAIAPGPFLVRLDAGGRVRWLKDGLDGLVAYASRLAVMPGGGFYLGGEFDRTFELDSIPFVSDGREELLLAKFDSAGRLVWARQAQRLAPETYFDGPHAVAVDAAGNVWMQGHASGVLGFDSQAVAAGPSQRVAFVVKYNNDSTLAWVKGAALQGGAWGESLAVDAVGRAYAVGTTRAHARFGTNELSSSSWDLVVAQIIDSALPPVVVTPPESLTRSVGQTATFTVVASGTPPLSYQWWRHLQPVPGATNATLILSNLQPADAGAYSVVVSNAFGVTGAGTAFLTVAGPVNLERVGTWPGFSAGRAVDVVVEGNRCYVALSEGGLAIFDVSDPLRPMPLGGWKNAGQANRMAVSGRYVYFADGPAGLQILDVNDPQHPALVRRYPTSGIAMAVQVVGSYAYVLSYDLGLEILDVRDPVHPVWVGGYDTPVEALGIHVVGQYAYVADGAGGLVILNVSDPTRPVLVGNSRTSDEAYDVRVVGRYAYVAYEEGGLHIVDVIDPAHPTLVGTYPLGESTWRLWVVGRYAYVAGGEAGLAVIDVNDPAHPTRVSSLGGMDVHAVQVVGQYAYIADEESGLLIADVSHPAQPTTVSIFPTQPAALDVQVVDHDAYLAAWRAGWHVIDVSNPAQPVRVGAFNTNGTAYGVKVVGARAYLADFSWGLRVLDVSDPSHPVQLGGQWGSSANACKADVAGPYAYVAEWYSRLQVVDVSDPTQLRRVGAFTNAQPAWDVQVVGRYAYVANGYAGLQVIDVSDPAHPMPAGSADVGYAYGVHVIGHHAYVAASDAGLRIVDVSDPSHPVSVGQCDTSRIAWDLFVAGPYAYIADGEAGVQVIDVSDPAQPRRVGGFHTGGDARNVYVAGEYVYVADMHGGLVILRSTPLVPPAPFVRRAIARPNVQLIATPPAGTSVYAVEDTPPTNWPAVNISHGGVFDGGKVKFGPFYDAQPRTLSYGVVMPPCWPPCPGYFTGTASADGVATPIVGDDRIVIPYPHPADLQPEDWSMSINEVTAYGSAWRRGETWPWPPNPISIDYVTRAGMLWRRGEQYQFDPLTNAPLWWVPWQGGTRVSPVLKYARTVVSSAEAPLPAYFVPGEPVTVTIQITPATGVEAYAVEDTVPAGWSVANLSPGGHWDAVNQRVKWGLFLDDTPRALSYQATPPSTAAGSVAFNGAVSCDGASVAIRGPRQLRASARLTVLHSGQPDSMSLRLLGPMNGRFLVETSTNLMEWTPLVEVTPSPGGTMLPLNLSLGEPQRFFRAKLIP
jgi:uncharacterized delta-60 repeat protein